MRHKQGMDTEVTVESVVIPLTSLWPGELRAAAAAAESTEGGPGTGIAVSQYMVSQSALNMRPGPLQSLELPNPQMGGG